MTSNSIGCGSPEAVLSALADDDARTILAATATKPRSVSELVDRCEIQSATAYRKVGQLVDAGLLDKRIRLSSTGRNPHEYALRVESLSVTVGPAGDLDMACVSETSVDGTDHRDGSEDESIGGSTNGRASASPANTAQNTR